MLTENEPNRPGPEWIPQPVDIVQHLRQSEQQQEHSQVVDGHTQLHFDSLKSERGHVGLTIGQGT